MGLHRITGIVSVAVMSLAAGCGKLDNNVNAAQERIVSVLNNQGIYERYNLPDPAPTPDKIKGYFEIVGGAYRHIVNEGREGRTRAGFEIARGDSIAFMFDARIFTGGNFENLQTFYTNMEGRIKQLSGNNPNFNGWSTESFKIKAGDDPRILKSLQEALVGGSVPCMAGDGNPDNDEQEDNIESDEVRIYLTPDIAFGNSAVYNVPAGSTIVFEITDIEIIR